MDARTRIFTKPGKEQPKLLNGNNLPNNKEPIIPAGKVRIKTFLKTD